MRGTGHRRGRRRGLESPRGRASPFSVAGRVWVSLSPIVSFRPPAPEASWSRQVSPRWNAGVFRLFAGWYGTCTVDARRCRGFGANLSLRRAVWKGGGFGWPVESWLGPIVRERQRRPARLPFKSLDPGALCRGFELDRDREEKRREEESETVAGRGRRGRKATGKTGSVWSYAGWVAVIVLIGIAVYPLVGSREEGRAEHPAPRVDVTADHVVPAASFLPHRTQRAYAIAATVPGTLDGIYCYCECARHAGHRSLLTCFESAHGSQCDICMGQAELAHRLLKEGKELTQIRAAIDAAYGA